MVPPAGVAALPSARLMGFALARSPRNKPEGLLRPHGFDSSAVGLTKKLPVVESWINVVPPAGVAALPAATLSGVALRAHPASVHWTLAPSRVRLPIGWPNKKAPHKGELD